MAKLYKCPFCGRNYEKIFALRRHIMKFHDTKDIKCPYCNFIADGIDVLKFHAVKKSDIYHQNLFYLLSRKHRHNVKKELFLAKENKSNIKVTNLRTIFQALLCPFCKKLFPRLYFLRQHIIIKHHSGILKCPYCNFIANNLSDLQEHLINFIIAYKETKHKNLYYLLIANYEKITDIEQFLARNYWQENIIPNMKKIKHKKIIEIVHHVLNLK
jgi:DNA-directed RNA polymerase subunit RPC12/RpoP